MPFKTLASLKKVTNLNAEVVALAPLETASVVAAVTTDPVQVSVHPFTGAKGKVTNVSLDDVNAVALINKAVAVVKSGDDLWALLDIQHTPKMEQVGRDIRSLHYCPKGDTALAIGWDGNAAELVFQNNEVGGRQFVLRGDLRACALSLDATYVVADGAGGGQLRGHPGPTPEPGASMRADLPAAASGMNLLAGGYDLSALAKAGGDGVCVVQREGASALTVKHLLVDGPVVAVAVITTSLFVLGADGKIRLYDGDTIRQAGDGSSVSPTFQLELRATGQPAVMCATTKGGNRLWVGTKGGDVLCCSAVKGGLNI